MKEIAWLSDEIATPPFSAGARQEAANLVQVLRLGGTVTMPKSRPMPSIGKRVHELRIREPNIFWRVVYRIDPDVLVVVAVFKKKTQATPKKEIDLCKKRLKRYDEGR